MSSPKKRWSPKNVRWANDADYLDKLTPAERAWYAQFADEFYNGSIKKGDSGAIHKTDAHRKDCYQRKNLMNNDVQSIFDSGGKMPRVEAESDKTPDEE